MVFLSEASIREMVQEALGGGGYPTLDGDGNFPIVPSPLAEPIVTKLGLQPVRVMRVPTDRHEFELAVKELVDGVEQDHLPTLFLKLRELVSNFVPEELESSPCPMDKTKEDEMATNKPPHPGTEVDKLRAEVRRLVRALIEESDHNDDEEDPDFKAAVAPFRPGGPKFMAPRPKAKDPVLSPTADDELGDVLGGDGSDDDDGPSFADDIGSPEHDGGEQPYPEEYLANQGYPDIGEDPDHQTWEDLEKEISGSAWEPDAGAELDKFRGRDDVSDQIDKAASAVDDAPKRPTDAVGGDMKWEDIGAALGISKGAAHGAAAIGARKLQYIGEYLGPKGFEEFYDDATDKYIEFLIQQGATKDEETGKPLLSMGEVMELRSASKFERDDDGDQVTRELDSESASTRKAIQGLEGFRDFVNQRLEYEMEVDGYAVKHSDAAKDKDKSSIFHRMKRTSS